MRALLNANIFISYLLPPRGPTPPARVVEAALANAYTLLITAQLLTAIHEKTSTKPYLAARITRSEVSRLTDVLTAVVETIPEIEEHLPEVGNDRKDDYLFAHALLGRADYLVSGDAGVLRIREIAGVRIVSPAQFIDILESTGQL